MSIIDILVAIGATALVIFTIVHNVRRSLRGDKCAGCDGCGAKKKPGGGCPTNRVK